MYNNLKWSRNIIFLNGKIIMVVKVFLLYRTPFSLHVPLYVSRYAA